MLNRVTAAMRDELRNEINIPGLDHHASFGPRNLPREAPDLLCDGIATGGDLYDRRYTEEKAIRIMKKVCHAIAYCHSRSGTP